MVCSWIDVQLSFLGSFLWVALIYESLTGLLLNLVPEDWATMSCCNVTLRSSSRDSSNYHCASLRGYCSLTCGLPFASDLERGRFDGTPFLSVAWHQGTLLAQSSVWVSAPVFLSTQTHCPFTTLVFPLVTTQLKTSWGFYKSWSKKKSRIIEEHFQLITTWDYYSKPTGFKHNIQKKEKG